jgi:hypothetical protein
MCVPTRETVVLSRKQWLALVCAAGWTAFWVYAVTGIHFVGSWYGFLSRIGEPLNAILLLAVPTVFGILIAGRWMRLQNWKQWALLSVIVVFHAQLWVSVLNDLGWHVAGTFAEFTAKRSHPRRLPKGEFLALVSVLGVSLGAGGLLIALLSPPGLWRRLKAFLSTSEHKQLATVLVAASWVSGAALSYECPLIEFGCEQRELARILGLVLPAMLFGAIFFWWFGRGGKGTKSDSK